LDDLERAKLYRQRAAELLAHAERTTNEEQKRIMLGIAAAYHRLAEALERGE